MRYRRSAHWARGFHAVLAFLLFLLAASCASLTVTEPPLVTLVDFALQEATLFEQRYRIRLRIRNPDRSALQIAGIRYAIELNGQAFIDGVGGTQTVVPAYGESVVEVTGISTLFGVLRQLSELRAERRTLDYRVSGALQLEEYLGRIPFAHQGSIVLPQPTGSGT